MLGRSGKPIIVGPWLSETGFELLYWIPFLAWAKAYGNFDPDRLIVMSRGGAAPWYLAHYAPVRRVCCFFTPDEFGSHDERRIVEQGGRQKHIEVTWFDREIIARVPARRGLSGAELLHPSQMYRLFDNFWLQRAPVTDADGTSSGCPSPRPPAGRPDRSPTSRRWSPLTITSNAPASSAYTTGSPAGPSSMSGWVWLRPSAVAASRSNEGDRLTLRSNRPERGIHEALGVLPVVLGRVGSRCGSFRVAGCDR